MNAMLVSRRDSDSVLEVESSTSIGHPSTHAGELLGKAGIRNPDNQVGFSE
jgi:hypothetical protein